MILSFAKPKKASSTEEHNRAHSSDCGVEGTYVPNMSQADKERWKAKVTGTRDRVHRLELRKQVGHVNMLIVVNGAMPGWVPVKEDAWRERRENKDHTPHMVKLSANGTLAFPPEIWAEAKAAVDEAYAVLSLLVNPVSEKPAMKTIRAGDHPLENS